jgi:hypothetical protein
MVFDIFFGMLGTGILIAIGIIALLAGIFMNITWLIIAGAAVVGLDILALILEKIFFGAIAKNKKKEK